MQLKTDATKCVFNFSLHKSLNLKMITKHALYVADQMASTVSVVH